MGRDDGGVENAGQPPRGIAGLLAPGFVARDTDAMPPDNQPQPVTPKPKRRWLQFDLRALLGLMAVVAVGMGLWVNSAERQKRAVAAVRGLGGNVIYDDGDPALERAWYRTLLGDDYFSSVGCVELYDTQVIDAILEHLKGLTQLEELHLSGDQVTDAGLEHLKGLTRLEVLILDDTQVTDAGIAELQKALPSCLIDGP